MKNINIRWLLYDDMREISVVKTRCCQIVASLPLDRLAIAKLRSDGIKLLSGASFLSPEKSGIPVLNPKKIESVHWNNMAY